MIKRRTVLKSALASAAVLAAPAIVRAQEKKVFRLPHTTPDSHPTGFGALEFKRLLEEKLPDRVEVQIFPNRQLGDDRQLFEQTMTGLLELGTAGTIMAPLVTSDPVMSAYQLPFLINSYDHFAELAKGPASQAMLQSLEQHGLVGLGVFDVGQRHFLATDAPVRDIDDFAGLKTRIVPVDLHKEIWEAIGTTPVGLDYGEIYGALETGVIDALEVNVSSVLSENLWEVGKHFTLTGHYFWPAMFLANTQALDAMDQEMQDAIRAAASEASENATMYSKQLDEEGRKQLEEHGVTIYELDDLAAMRSKVEPLVERWANTSPLIADFIAEANA